MDDGRRGSSTVLQSALSILDETTLDEISRCHSARPGLHCAVYEPPGQRRPRPRSRRPHPTRVGLVRATVSSGPGAVASESSRADPGRGCRSDGARRALRVHGVSTPSSSGVHRVFGECAVSLQTAIDQQDSPLRSMWSRCHGPGSRGSARRAGDSAGPSASGCKVDRPPDPGSCVSRGRGDRRRRPLIEVREEVHPSRVHLGPTPRSPSVPATFPIETAKAHDRSRPGPTGDRDLPTGSRPGRSGCDAGDG